MTTANDTRTLTVLPSMCDASGRLSFPSALDLFMDTATLHAEKLGIGFTEMSRRGLFWITSKTRVHFLRRPRITEAVEVSTWVLKPGKARCEREYALSAGGETLAYAETVWAVMDMKAGRLFPVCDVYPEDLVLTDGPAFSQPFAAIGKDFSDCTPLGSYTVRSVDIDLGGHMNNVAYVRAMFGCFSNEQLKQFRFTDLEISFVSQCFEGETIRFVCRQCESGIEVAALNAQGKPAILAKLW